MAARAGLPCIYLILVVLVYACISTINGDEQQIRREKSVDEQGEARRLKSSPPPNIIIFLVDDLGWNQVGYHAAPSGNNEVKTPYIDHYATTGIEMDRGSMTPWYVALGCRQSK
jgi:hypothetical protein